MIIRWMIYGTCEQPAVFYTQDLYVVALGQVIIISQLLQQHLHFHFMIMHTIL